MYCVDPENHRVSLRACRIGHRLPALSVISSCLVCHIPRRRFLSFTWNPEQSPSNSRNVFVGAQVLHL
jgi:hypothetical protein